MRNLILVFMLLVGTVGANASTCISVPEYEWRIGWTAIGTPYPYQVLVYKTYCGEEE